MENTNEDIDIALYDLKDFIVKNDAELDEGVGVGGIVGWGLHANIDCVARVDVFHSGLDAVFDRFGSVSESEELKAAIEAR